MLPQHSSPDVFNRIESSKDFWLASNNICIEEDKQFIENYSSTCFQNIIKSCRERDGKKNLFEFLRSINTKI